jgi:hypothetical protein
MLHIVCDKCGRNTKVIDWCAEITVDCSKKQACNLGDQCAARCPDLPRVTNAFSKKIENLQAAIALHFSHYNLVRLHKTLRITPAMAAGVTNRVWSLEELVERTSG